MNTLLIQMGWVSDKCLLLSLFLDVAKHLVVYNVHKSTNKNKSRTVEGILVKKKARHCQFLLRPLGTGL